FALWGQIHDQTVRQSRVVGGPLQQYSPQFAPIVDTTDLEWERAPERTVLVECERRGTGTTFIQRFADPGFGPYLAGSKLTFRCGWPLRVLESRAIQGLWLSPPGWKPPSWLARSNFWPPYNPLPRPYVPLGIIPSGLFGDALLYSLLMLLARAALAVARRVTRRLRGRCPSCGYGLAGLPYPTRCPECGIQLRNVAKT